MYKTCQACGETIFSQSYMGTDSQGNINPDFCAACLKNGRFAGRARAAVPSRSIYAINAAQNPVLGFGMAGGYFGGVAMPKPEDYIDNRQPLLR